MDRGGDGADGDGDTGAKEIPPSDRLEIESTRTEIANGDFPPSRSIREVVFIGPSRCRAIKGFSNFVSLFRVVIPRSAEVIGSRGFHYCRSLTEVLFESGSHLTRIDGFNFCPALSRIAIPSSVEIIDTPAFHTCTSLAEVIFESGSCLKRNDGCVECRSLRQIALPPSLETIALYGFSGCTSLMEVIFEPGSEVNSIAGFHGCKSLSRIALPPSLQSLQSVHWAAFLKCGSFRAVYTAFGNRVPADARLRKIKCFVIYPDESLKGKRRGFSLRFVWRNVSGGLLSL
jgi:hypothetical protein